MLVVERTKTITKLAFPVGVALSSTLTMELVDLVMVGRLGNTAIAAVGLSIFTSNVVFAFMTGITFAVQGIVARSRGEGSQLPAWLPLRGGIMIALLAGAPLTILAYVLTPFFVFTDFL
jgi:Na+-driven multidrug efflux pump